MKLSADTYRPSWRVLAPLGKATHRVGIVEKLGADVTTYKAIKVAHLVRRDAIQALGGADVAVAVVAVEPRTQRGQRVSITEVLAGMVPARVVFEF